MFQKILCPVDGTEHAMLALEQAVALAGACGAGLTICVVSGASGRSPRINHWTDDQVATLLGQAEASAKALRPMRHGAAVVARGGTGDRAICRNGWL
jgi:nucleotide-binding universal stress UspA family protein